MIKLTQIKVFLPYLILLLLGLITYHFLVLIPSANRRDEIKYQTCINKVHLSFQTQWNDECKKIQKGDNCGLDTDIASKLEEWRQKNNNICVVALSWSK